MSVINAQINVGIIGATGYTGLELVKILIKHSKFKLSYIANSEGNTTINELHPSLNGVCELEVKKLSLKSVLHLVNLYF